MQTLTTLTEASSITQAKVCLVCVAVCLYVLLGVTSLGLSQDYQSYHVAFCVTSSYISTKWDLAVGVSCNRYCGWKWRIKEIKEKEGKKREGEKMDGGHASVYCVQCVCLRD